MTRSAWDKEPPAYRSVWQCLRDWWWPDDARARRPGRGGGGLFF